MKAKRGHSDFDFSLPLVVIFGGKFELAVIKKSCKMSEISENSFQILLAFLHLSTGNPDGLDKTVESCKKIPKV